MNRTTIALYAMALLCAGPILLVAAAHAAPILPPQILACSTEQDVIVRLACYDREVAAFVASPPEPATYSPPPVRQPAPTTAVTDAPAADTRVAPATKTRPEDKSGFGFDPRMDEISATVVKIREQPYGELLIWLDNDQVWEQNQLDRRFKLRVGETVTVKKGRFSGYRLSGNSNKSIQVTRRK